MLFLLFSQILRSGVFIIFYFFVALKLLSTLFKLTGPLVKKKKIFKENLY